MIFLNCLRLLNKIITKDSYFKKKKWICEDLVSLKGQDGNDYVKQQITDCFEKKRGLLICKFGTNELSSLYCWKIRKRGVKPKDYFNYVKGYGQLDISRSLHFMCKNAGFFPKSSNLLKRYNELIYDDLGLIDILGSYINLEKEFSHELQSARKINLNSYLYPFLWKNPWSSVLKDKKVLVIHPFVESIRKQYDKREFLFQDKNVLPKFKSLILIKAVQSINGEKTGFSNWFSALEYMEKEIDKVDFDIAIIGCGAYGMPLATYIKKKGKIAIHMAGSTQMLFGIYGKRWENDSTFNPYINQNWIKPSEEEAINGLKRIEDGCYI